MFCCLRISFLHTACFHTLSLQKIQATRECRLMVLRWFQAQRHFYFVIFFTTVICAHLTVDISVWSHKRSGNFRMSRGTFIFLCIIEVFFGEKRHSYEISYTFGAEICNSSVETSYKWWLQNKCPLVCCLQSIWLPHCTGCLCCHCASVATKVHSDLSHGEHLQSIVEGLLASGVFPSVLMLSMGPISPSCHPAWLTIIIGKGSIQSSYKLQRTTSIVFGTSMLAGQGGYTMLVYLLIQSYLKRPKWVLCCHPPPG